MSLLHYLDMEQPLLTDDWDVVTQNAPSTAVRSTDAAFPERGSNGLKVTISGANTAFVRKNTTITIPDSGSVYCGFWFRIPAMPSATTRILRFFSALEIARLDLRLIGSLELIIRDDGGGVNSLGLSFSLVQDRWYWVVIRLLRSANAGSNDGGGTLWVDGVEENSDDTLDVYVRAPDLQNVQLGVNSLPQDGTILGFDEVKISTTYPEPFIPEPTTANPSAERTVVLWRQASSDSREFADYCVSELSIPRSNLVPLPNASANESLADYATFQTEIEDDLNAWLTLNPTVEAQATCFLQGYGVPGYFDDGIHNISVNSRLWVLGDAFVTGDNDLYQTTARLTKAVLGAGHYMSVRIDADTLANAKLILDAGITTTALAELRDGDILYTDDTTFLASTNFGQLRILSSAIGTLSNGAFIWGDIGTPSFGFASLRVAFIDTDSAASAEGLRATGASECAAALITGGYAAIGGTNDGTNFENPDVDTFFGHLFAGHTFAEAARCTTKKTDWKFTWAGNPLMTVAFQDDGYNLYSGIIGSIDYDTVIAYFRRGVATGSLVITPDADTQYEYSLRAVRNNIETPGVDAVTDFKTDGGADWEGNRPDPVFNELFEQASGAVLKVGWDYITGATAAADFALWVDTVEPDGSGAPDATVVYAADIPYTQDFTLVDGTAYFVRIVARSAGAVESDPVIVGPLLADSSAPDVPAQLITQTF